jgi:hypothetical protein
MLGDGKCRGCHERSKISATFGTQCCGCEEPSTKEMEK